MECGSCQRSGQNRAGNPGHPLISSMPSGPSLPPLRAAGAEVHWHHRDAAARRAGEQRGAKRWTARVEDGTVSRVARRAQRQIGVGGKGRGEQAGHVVAQTRALLRACGSIRMPNRHDAQRPGQYTLLIHPINASDP
jgi:hypothetical protein